MGFSVKGAGGECLEVIKGRGSIVETIQRAGTVLLFAPSSYLGKIYLMSSISGIKEKIPDLQIIAVDDFYFNEKIDVEGVDRIVPSRDILKEEFSGLPSVNYAYAVNTWSFFDKLATEAGCQKFDLPELLEPLDLPLVYESGQRTRQLTVEYKDAFDRLRLRFSDALSLDTLNAVTQMRMTGERSALLDVICPGEQEYFSFYNTVDHPLRLSSVEHYVDIGAYDGDTLQKFLSSVRYRFSSVHAFEPDPANFSVLEHSFKGRYPSVFLHNKAVSSSNEPLFFSAKGTMGSRVEEAGNIKVDCVRLDDVLEDVTFLKMDVEGFEANVLRGAGRLIGLNRPKMAITCYHHVCDILDIVSVLDDIYPGANLKLRHYSMWYYDTILYVE